MKTILLKSTLVSLFLLLGIIHSVRSQSLPTDFPTFKTTLSGKTAPGKIFLSTSSMLPGIGYYVFMANNDGTVEKYYKIQHEEEIYDFTMQCDGRFSFNEFIHPHSYVGGGDATYKFLSNDFTHETSSMQMGNEYLGESHDFQVLPNGHMLCFSYSPEKFDLTKLVTGGYPDAKVYATIIQELDVDGKVVFQWRFWDHFKLSDIGKSKLAATAEMDAVHTNSVDLDTDGNIIFSSLRLGTITKISRQTGNVMWQLGGKFNKFRFTNIDSTLAVGMFTGHDFRRLKNGNVLFYNNNVRNTKQPSRVIEWKLDEKNLTATKIWEYDSNGILAWHRGNATRFDNGNTLIGWGDDDALNGPNCTEVDSLGKIVFELKFDNPSMSSFRAFRFEYPTLPKTDWSKYELSVGSFNFIQGDTLNSGVSLDVSSIQADGYNTLNVKTFDLAPLQPLFPGKAPRVYKHKILLNKQSIASMQGNINFDVPTFGIKNPEGITVYARKFINQKGLFLPLTTTYNKFTNKIVAGFSMAQESNDMEFIFTYPDLEEILVTPKTLTPLNGTAADNKLPIRLEWSTNGFISDFNLQIATDSTFSSNVINTEGLQSTVYYFSGAKTNQQYYWRVRTNNEAGYSNWSDKSRFVAGKPEIQILSPKGDEVWKRGASNFIYWKTNFLDSVVIKLYKNDKLIQALATVYTNMAYKWTIPAKLDSSCGYYIAIEQLHHPEIIGRSPKTFSIQNPTCVNTQVPFVNVLKPVADEKWKQGTTHTISWSDNIADELQLALYKNEILVQDISSSTGNNLNWQVPVNTPVGSGYQIKISDKLNPVYSAMSDNIEITDSIQTGTIGLNLGSNEFSVYPNPVNDNMTVNFYLENPTPVTLEVFDILGVKVDSWNHLEGKSGSQTVTKNIRNIPSGIYLVKLKTNSKTLSKRVIVKK